MIEYRQNHKRKSSRRRRRRKTSEKRKDTAVQEPQNSPEVPPPSFHSFSKLPQDVKLYILSYIAEASMNAKHSPLTHVLPLVSHEFHDLSKSDCLWQAALERLVEKEPFLWREGFMKLCHCDKQEEYSPRELIKLAHSKLHEPGYFRLYRMVVARCMRFTSPIFCMPNRRVQLKTPIALHLFEPRYRLLIQLVMEGYPMDLRDGRDMTTRVEELPVFVYAHVPPFTASSRACLVQVQRCLIDEHDGTANVLLLPIAYVKLERVWERPNSGHLFFAQCIRLSESDSNQLAGEEVAQHVRGRRQGTARDCMPCSIL